MILSKKKKKRLDKFIGRKFHQELLNANVFCSGYGSDRISACLFCYTHLGACFLLLVKIDAVLDGPWSDTY